VEIPALSRIAISSGGMEKFYPAASPLASVSLTKFSQIPVHGRWGSQALIFLDHSI
jgi:hypothetical protein